MKMKQSAKRLSFLDEELYYLHRLIKTKSTGTPQQLAQKLDCSGVQLLLKRLKINLNKGINIREIELQSP